jgi:hypothetical protein
MFPAAGRDTWACIVMAVVTKSAVIARMWMVDLNEIEIMKASSG